MSARTIIWITFVISGALSIYSAPAPSPGESAIHYVLGEPSGFEMLWNFVSALSLAVAILLHLTEEKAP